MQLLIGGHTITTFNQSTINLKYDSIADTFSILLLFDPKNSTHTAIFKPGAYPIVKITHFGALVMTGIVLNYSFSDSPTEPGQLLEIQGYSLTGLLCDSNIVASETLNPYVQFNGQTLQAIAQNICNLFELKLVIDSELMSDAAFNTAYTNVNIEPSQSYEDILIMLCAQKNVNLTHKADGSLFLTRVKANAYLTTSNTVVYIPNATMNDVDSNHLKTVTTETSHERTVLYSFNIPNPNSNNPSQWLEMNLEFKGQGIHSIIQVSTQNDGTVANQYLDPPNIYVVRGSNTGYRYKRFIQSTGENTDVLDTCRSIQGDELKNIVLTIKVQGWTLAGHLITPNQIVTVNNPNLHLYTTNKWFIQEVELYTDTKEEYAVLTCVLPDCFGTDDVTINVFN